MIPLLSFKRKKVMNGTITATAIIETRLDTRFVMLSKKFMNVADIQVSILAAMVPDLIKGIYFIMERSRLRRYCLTWLWLIDVSILYDL